MTGKELYKKLSRRDYSGSDDDVYAQWLQTLFLQLPSSDFYKLLEKSEKLGKKIIPKDSKADEFTIDSLILS
ncbi:MAG: hypothetical protein E2590_12765 [Chryseobacterium sp.]|nr:hypothetical protein [Chryseobacterium sp.]